MNADPQNTRRIEPAGEQELQAIADLAAVIWRAHYPGIITSDQIEYMLTRMYALETMRRELRSGIRYDCLFLGAELAGFAAYGPTEQSGVFKLHKLYLHPERHGRGLGRLLLQHAEREARGLGGRQMILSVNKRNSKAIAAYERNGFAITESVVVDIGGGFAMDDYLMAKNL